MDSSGFHDAPDRGTLGQERRWLDAVRHHALISKSFPYAYYFAPKAACTTIKTLLWRAELQYGGACAEIPNFDFVHEQQFSPRSPWERPENISPRLAAEFEQREWFLFVRNPYARVYSAYVWLLRDANPKTRAGYMNRLGWGHERLPSFAAFVELICEQPLEDRDHHWAPITSFTPIEKIGFQFIGATERFETDFKTLLQHLFGNDASFDPTVHMYRSKQRPWTDEIKDIPSHVFSQIRSMHDQDFVQFGYDDDPAILEPAVANLAKAARGGGLSRTLRSRIHIDALTRNNGPDPTTRAIIAARFPQADSNGLQGLVLRDQEMPSWWTAGGSQLWTRLNAPLPNISQHPGAPPPRNSLVVVAGADFPGEIVLWGDDATVVLARESTLAGGLLSCGGQAGIYIGPDTRCDGICQIDARNGGAVFVAGDGLWHSDVKLMSDGLHAIRDRKTNLRLNSYGGEIFVGRHVWLSAGVMLKGGAHLGDDVVVEPHSVVQSLIPAHSVCAGAPAIVTREDTTWTFENEP